MWSIDSLSTLKFFMLSTIKIKMRFYCTQNLINKINPSLFSGKLVSIHWLAVLCAHGFAYILQSYESLIHPNFSLNIQIVVGCYKTAGIIFFTKNGIQKTINSLTCDLLGLNMWQQTYMIENTLCWCTDLGLL